MGLFLEFHEAMGRGAAQRNRGLTILPDKSAYHSPLDGSVVEGRTAHREHMKRHGVVEAGDRPLGSNDVDRAPMSAVRHDVHRAIAELNR